MQKKKKARLRNLPSVAALLENRRLTALAGKVDRSLLTSLLREELERLRAAVRSGELDPEGLAREASADRIGEAIEAALDELLETRPRTVINATGVVVHTNLGRAILSASAAERIAASARGYVDLEYDVERGGRGNRLDPFAPLMARLFPGSGFTIVNNNAAATLLCLRALARKREVIVSRGELVEIGGSFRVPDILSASGAKLVEVGTTNRTRLADYRKALGKRTGMLLKVHTSNFRIVGFAEETSVGKLAGLARKAGVPLVVDWGSGDLIDLGPLGIRDETPVHELLAAGADLVTFSGDKLLGGPQCGFVVGRPALVKRVRKDPMARVCRLDRLRVGALMETLGAYVRGSAAEDVPTLRMIATDAAEIERRAGRVKDAVARQTPAGKKIRIVDGVSRTGGGSSPTGERPTRLLAVPSPSGDAGRIEERLRRGDPPVIGRLHEGELLLDLRTVLEEQEASLIASLVAAIEAEGES